MAKRPNSHAGHSQNWSLKKGETLDQAIKAAKQRYMVGVGDYSEDDMSLSSSELKSLTDCSDDGSYSAYDDEECPDCSDDVV